MAAKKNILGFVDPRGQKGRAPLIGMQFLHERPVGLANVARARPRLQAKDLIGLLLRHFTAAAKPRPRCRTRIRVFTPAVQCRAHRAVCSRNDL
jgi:hypothetical protein